MSEIREVVILAAGLGSRLQSLGGGEQVVLKPLVPVGGKAILRRVLEKCAGCGVGRVVIVTGFEAERLVSAVESWSVPVDVVFAHNPEFRKDNGVSLLCGARACEGDFALLMADHLFENSTLVDLMARGLGDDLGVLATDRKLATVFDMDDATKVWQQGDRIIRISKKLTEFNAVDTGMFIFHRDTVIESLSSRIEENGDASVSNMVQNLIAMGRMSAFDIGDRTWQDVDDPAMYGHAEELLARGVF